MLVVVQGMKHNDLSIAVHKQISMSKQKAVEHMQENFRSEVKPHLK
jgi:hypothetical protein